MDTRPQWGEVVRGLGAGLLLATVLYEKFDPAEITDILRVGGIVLLFIDAPAIAMKRTKLSRR